MTLTATDAAIGVPNGATRGGLTVQWPADDRRRTSPTIPAQRARPRGAVRRVLIYDSRPEARAALTLRITAAVPAVNDITCAATSADLIASFGGHPADLVFIGVEHQACSAVDTAALFLRQYPTATVIVFGAILDIPALTAAVARGAVGLMLWHPWHDHPLQPPARPLVQRGTEDHTMTRGERGILQGMSRGLSNREIGVQLNLSEETVKAKARVLYRKLGARDRAHAVALALRQQLLS
jgi:DNA-binding NarL/FixJ family response regulator